VRGRTCVGLLLVLGGGGVGGAFGGRGMNLSRGEQLGLLPEHFVTTLASEKTGSKKGLDASLGPKDG